MNVDYAFVAEAADSQAGLFYVTRGGADIYFLPPDFPKPLRLGAISFVVRVVAESHEVGRPLPVVCTIVDADGRPTDFRQEAQIVFTPHPIDPTRATGTVMAFRFYGFPLPDFGGYFFEVRSGEHRLAQVPFWVVPAQDGAAGSAGGASAEREPGGYL